MVAVEAAIGKILVDVALSTGVDVLSKRASSPLIRGAAHLHRAYALVSLAEGAYSAIRICAYSDATRLISQEAVVEIGSKQVAKALLQLGTANYEVHRKAEKYLLTPEFAEASQDSHPLAGWVITNSSFGADDMAGFGRPLATQTAACVRRAARARDIAVELVSYPEAGAARRTRNWNREPIWTDRVNSQLGYIFWQPAPEIGLGMRLIGDSITYSGIFRRDDPEGYGCVRWPDGTRYYGQTRRGFPNGYGAYYHRDGSAYLGKIGYNYHLGASISPKRDWVYYGEHKNMDQTGHGRRVGRANGMESATGLWREGRLTHPFRTMAELYRGIVSKHREPVLEGFRREYQQKADDAERALAQSDLMVLGLLTRDL
ncbi:MAG TPA: hypothetical protein VF619_01075 [Allosphingosinicella sp.]|jgi:hypothetical protein